MYIACDTALHNYSKHNSAHYSCQYIHNLFYKNNVIQSTGKDKEKNSNDQYILRDCKLPDGGYLQTSLYFAILI